MVFSTVDPGPAFEEWPALGFRTGSQGGALLKEAHPFIPRQETRVQSSQGSGPLAVIHLRPCKCLGSKPPGVHQSPPQEGPGSP